jgi:hypothetical protein
MYELIVETAENGFVVYEGSRKEAGVNRKRWAFETATSLSAFVETWGDGNTKTVTGPENSES